MKPRLLIAVTIVAINTSAWLLWHFDAARKTGGNQGVSGDDDYRRKTIDFGVVSPGAEAVGEAQIQNDSDVVWTLDKTISSCGCAVEHFSPLEVAPGAVGTLAVRYTAGEEQGLIDRQVVVRFLETRAPIVVVSLEGAVRDWARPQPSILNLDSIRPGGSTYTTFGVVNHSEIPINWRNTTTSVPWVEVKEGKTTSKGVSDCTLYCAPPIDARLGRHDEHIVLVSADGEKRLRVPFHVHIAPRVEVRPRQLFFGFVESETQVKKNVSLVFHSTSSVPSEDVSLSHTLDAELDISIAHGTKANSLFLEATLSPRKNTGVRLGVISLKTSKGEVLAEISVQANVVDQEQVR